MKAETLSRLLKSNFFMLSIFLIFAGLLCAHNQFNFNWDFTNYHYYNAFAFLNDRLNYDIVPGSVNTFFNPLIELPLYFYIEYFNDYPAVVYALQGLWFGLLLFVFYKFSTLFFDVNKLQGQFQLLLTLAIAITGQATYFQAGSSTNEIQIALLVYSALYILAKMIKFPDTQQTQKFFFAGFILGSALGLKSTCVYLCITCGICLIICHKYLKNPIKFVILFALGGFIGFLLLNGWWMYKMWSLYGNPFFPFLNGIFHSPYFDDFNFSDRRFIPPLHIAPIFPYIWFRGIYKTAEIGFYDIRGALFYTIALLFIGYMLIKPERIKKFYTQKRLWCFFSVFMILGYILWLVSFSIYRYLVVIEMGGAIILVKVLSLYKPKSDIKFILYTSFKLVLYGILILNYKEGITWPVKSTEIQKFVHIEEVHLPENTLLKLYNYPTAGVIPILAKYNTFRALGYKHLNTMMMQGSDFVERGKFREMRDKIEQEHTGPIVVIFRELSVFSNNRNDLIEALKPVTEGMYCRLLNSSLDRSLNICVPEELKNEILKEENNDAQ